MTKQKILTFNYTNILDFDKQINDTLNDGWNLTLDSTKILTTTKSCPDSKHTVISGYVLLTKQV